MSLFASKHNGLVAASPLSIFIFRSFLFFSSLPMSVTTHSDCYLHTNNFSEQSYCRHTPLVILIMDLSSELETTPSTANDLASAPHLYPLFSHWRNHTSTPLLSGGGPPIKNSLGLMMRWRHTDITRRQELLRDLVFLGSLLT